MAFYLQPCGKSNDIACLAMFTTNRKTGQSITWSFLMTQSVGFAIAPEICLGSRQMLRLLPRLICFLVSASAKKKKKKNADEIKFLGILEKMCLQEQNMFLFKKKAMFCLNKKLFLSLAQFSNLIS